MGCIYVVRNQINGKEYIGKTVSLLKYRRNEHEKASNRGSKSPFHVALRTFGFGQFSWKRLELSDDEIELNRLEVDYIKDRRTKVPNGYNLTDGGEDDSSGTMSMLNEAHHVGMQVVMFQEKDWGNDDSSSSS